MRRRIRPFSRADLPSRMICKVLNSRRSLGVAALLTGSLSAVLIAIVIVSHAVLHVREPTLVAYIVPNVVLLAIILLIAWIAVSLSTSRR